MDAYNIGNCIKTLIIWGLVWQGQLAGADVLAGDVGLNGGVSPDYNNAVIYNNNNNQLVDHNNSYYLPNPELINGGNSKATKSAELIPSNITFQAGEEWKTHFVDPLTLQLITKFTFTFQMRPSLQNSTDPKLRLSDGKYLLRMAVIIPEKASAQYSNYFSLDRKLTMNERIVSWFQDYVYVDDGQIKKEVNFPFPNISATTIMTSLLVELTPVEDAAKAIGKANVRPIVVSGPFLPMNRGGSIISDTRVRRLKAAPKKGVSLSQHIAAFEKFRRFKRSQVTIYRNSLQAAAEFARSENLKMLSLNSKELQPVMDSAWARGGGAQELQQILDTTSNEAIPLYKNKLAIGMLCQMLALHKFNVRPMYLASASMGATLGDCATRPEKYLRVSKNLHVIKFDQASAKTVQRSPISLNMSGSFMVSRGRSQDVGTGVSVNPLAPLFKLLDMIGLGGTAGFSHTVSYSTGRGENASAIISNSSGLSVGIVKAYLPLSKFRSCLIVEGAPFKKNPFFAESEYIGQNPLADNPQSKRTGIYLCNTKEEKDFTVMESYAHFYESIQDVPMTDNLSPETQGVNMAFRGERDINAFLYNIRENMREYKDIEYDSGKILATTLAQVQAGRSLTTNVIGMPVYVNAPPTVGPPTLWEKLSGAYKEKMPDYQE